MCAKSAVLKIVIRQPDRLSERDAADIATACRRLEANLISSCTTGTMARSDVRGAIVVAGLRVGERRIPKDLVDLLNSNPPATSLLLICEEPLVRPSVSLRDGRIALVGASSGVEAIVSRMRVLFATQSTLAGLDTPDESASALWWSRHTKPHGTHSLQWTDEKGGFSLLFALKEALHVSPGARDDIRALPRRNEPASEPDQAPAGKIEAHVGRVRYCPKPGEWVIEWPSSPKTLWMLSPVRLPVMSDLSRCTRDMMRLQASSGDIIVALSEDGALSVGSDLVRGVSERVAWGGPSVFDAVREKLDSCPCAWATVTELR